MSSSSKRGFKEMTILEHLTELGKRLKVVAIAFMIGFLGAWLPMPNPYYSIVDYFREFIHGFFTLEYRPIAAWIFNATVMSQLPEHVRVIPTHPLSPLVLAFELSALIGIVVAMPVLLYEIYQYVKPGLYSHELRIFKLYFLSAALLFGGGLVFGYYVIYPAIIRLYEFWCNLMNLESFLTIKGLMDTFIGTLIFSGIIFETPVVMAVLTHLEVTSPKAFTEYRRIIYFVALVLIAIFNPDPTVVTTLLWFFSFVILYEAGVFVSKRIYRKLRRTREI